MSQTNNIRVKRFQFSEETNLYHLDGQNQKLTESELINLVLLMPETNFSIIGAMPSLKQELGKHRTPESQIVSLVIFT